MTHDPKRSPSASAQAGPARRCAVVVGGLAVVGLVAGCGGGERKQDDARVQKLTQQVAQLSARVKAQDQRISALGTAAGATPMAASTQSGPDNTVVAQCPPGAFLFRLPRTPSQGGEALCRAVAAPTAAEIKGH